MTDYSQKRAGNYSIISKLGDGGFATVYLGQHTILEKKAAVKFLLEDWVDEQDVVDRFFDEARTMERLHDNPGIVKIIDIATVEKCKEEGLPPYFIMEYIDGKSLEDIIKSDEGFTLEEIVRIMASALSALQHCHDNGVVHRDIKPSNFMINSSGEVKLTDFGIAKACKNTSKTGEGLTLGSTDYMSPEQALGKRDLDYRSDIYSLGVTLYQMVCDRLPFVGDSPNAIALKHIQEKPVPPGDFSELIPMRLSDVIMKAMEKDKEHRFQSCNEMLEALKKVEEPEELLVEEISTVDLTSLRPDSDDDLCGMGSLDSPDDSSTTRQFSTKPPVALINSLRIVFIILGFTGLFLLVFKGYSLLTQVGFSINTSPAGAMVMVNRETMGVTPIDFKLPPSGYLIHLAMPGYATASLFFATVSRQDLNINHKLFPLVSEEVEPFAKELLLLRKLLRAKPSEAPRLKKDLLSYERLLGELKEQWAQLFGILTRLYDDEEIHSMFLEFCLKNKYLDKADEFYKELIKGKPALNTFVFAGMVKKLLDDRKEALRCFMEAWTISQNNRLLLNSLGDFFVEDDQGVKAKQYYEMSLFLYPEQEEIRKKLEALN